MVPGSRFQVEGSNFRISGVVFLVQSSKFQVHGSRFQVRCFRFLVQGSQYQIPGSRFQDQGLEAKFFSCQVVVSGMSPGLALIFGHLDAWFRPVWF